jgi:hypothetical protein
VLGQRPLKFRRVRAHRLVVTSTTANASTSRTVTVPISRPSCG